MTSFYPIVGAETANDILAELAEELAKRVIDQVRTLAPDGLVVTTYRNPPKEQFVSTLDMTYPPDLPMALDPDWVPLVKRGRLPPPVSPHWANVHGLPTEMAQDIQREFREQWRQFVAGVE